MNSDPLTAALHACAAGLYPLEAGVAPAHQQWHVPAPRRLHQPVHHHRDKHQRRHHPDGRHRLDAAITALNAGDLPCSGGERRILQLSASLAAEIPADLQDAVTGLDDRNIALLVSAIRHASGRFP